MCSQGVYKQIACDLQEKKLHTEEMKRNCCDACYEHYYWRCEKSGKMAKFPEGNI